MSTEAAPVTPPAPPPVATSIDGRTLTLGEFDAEIGAHAYNDPSGKPFVPLHVAKAMREEMKALKAKSADPEALKPIRDQIRGELEQEYGARVVEAQLDGALYRHGFADDAETREEVLSRYSAVKPDAEGKRPSLPEWLKAQRAANDGQGARWVRAYLQTPADPAPPVKPAADAKPPPTNTKPPPKSDPNGGASRTGAPPPVTGEISEEQFRAMTREQQKANLEAYMASARKRGAIA